MARTPQQELEELRTAHQELRDRLGQYRSLLELSADWYWKQDENFRFVDLGVTTEWPADLPPMGHLLGKARWEVEGTYVAEGWDRHRRMLERREPFRNVDIRHRTNDGNNRVMSLSGMPVFAQDGAFKGYVGVARDVTERRIAQEALEESQRMLSALMGNLPGMAYRCRNAIDWPLDFASEGAALLTGHLPADLMRNQPSYGDLIHPDDRQNVWAQVQSALARRQQFQLTYRLLSLQGEKWVWEQGAGVFGPAGELRCLEGFISDITQTRRAQQEIAQLNEHLEERVQERTQQLQAANAELEAFAYSVAHDLRAPLTALDGFSRLARQNCAGGDARTEHYFQRITANVQRMSELTDALLALARLSNVDLQDEDVDLAALARHAFAQLAEAHPQADATLDAPAQLPARGDARLLSQLLANLVGNAWKFSQRKGRIRIRIAAAPDGGAGTVYQVADEGAGFDMAHAARLFKAFERLHPAAEFEGTGIGLALVHKIVARHGGRVWAAAEPGRGATFFFTLGRAA
jgi:PAS domain S-box-containing protein